LRPLWRAEASYREAIAIARQQSTKLWELCAAMSPAQLLRDQGEHANARNLLAQSTIGSPRVSARRFCKRRRRCSTPWHNTLVIPAKAGIHGRYRYRLSPGRQKQTQ
jgi:hypothetical protein